MDPAFQNLISDPDYIMYVIMNEYGIKYISIFFVLEAGLGTVFFSVRYVPFFSVLL